MGKKSKLKKLAARMGQLDQVAALPYRMGKQGLEILVVTSRKTKRLITPKGWPMPGLSDSRAAEIEADEEAGVKGAVSKHPVGSFEYPSRFRPRIPAPRSSLGRRVSRAIRPTRQIRPAIMWHWVAAASASSSPT